MEVHHAELEQHCSAELQLELIGLLVAVSLDRNLEGVYEEVPQDILVQDVPAGYPA